MRISKIILVSFILFIFVACSVSNRGKVNSQKDLKAEKKQIEFQYSFFEANKQKMLGNINEAGAYYLRCIELIPESAAANYEFAGIMGLAKDFENGIEYAEKACEIDPDNIWYNALLVSMHKSAGNLKKSGLLLEDLLKKHPNDYNSYLELTDIYLKLNQSKDALLTLDRFEKKYGFSEALMVEKNRIHIRAGQFDKARVEVEKMIQLEPQNISLQLLKANFLLEEGKDEKAFDSYQEILKKDPENGSVHFSLSEYYQKKGEEEKAFDELEKAMSSEDVDLDLKVKLLFSYVNIKTPSATEKKQVYHLIRILLKMYPDNMKVRSLYSDILVKDKLYKEAQVELILITEKSPKQFVVWEQLLFVDNQLTDFPALYQHSVQMIEYYPNKSIAYFFAGLAGYQTKKYKSSVDYLELGIDLSFEDTVLQAQFYTILGDGYHRLRKDEKSDDAYEQAIRLNPTNYYVHNNYAYYLSVRKTKLERAKALMQDCIKQHPKNGTYLDTFAWVLYQKREYKLALEIIERAYVNGGRKSAVITEHFGDILFVNNKKSEAVLKWKEAQSIGMGSSLLDKKIIEENLFEE